MKQFITAGLLLLVAAACSENNTTNPVKDTDQKIPVKTSVAQLRNYTPYLELSGTAFADREANLGAALPGRIEKIYFPAGSRVRKGDLLVSMSGEMYTQALSEYTTMEKDFERVSRLNEKESVSKQDYDHVKALYETSKAKLEMMKKNAEITAPFSGIITEYLVQEGENYFFNFNLDPGYSSTSGILRLMKTDPIQVSVDINEKDLSSVKTGQEALIRFDATGDSVFAGSVSSVKPVLSSLTHTAAVKIRIENSRGLLMPGMFAHVRIRLKSMNSVCVPPDAIYRRPGSAEDYVFIVEGEKVRSTRVQKLWVDDDLVAVTVVRPGDIVVTAGKEKLHQGSLVIMK